MESFENLSAHALFRRIRIPLDKARSEKDSQYSELNIPFFGIKIINASSDNALVEILPNYPIDRGDPLPLKNGEFFNFPKKINGASLRFSAQAGEWVEFCLSLEAPFPQTSSKVTVSSITGAIKMIDGNNLNVFNALSNISTADVKLFNANTSRTLINICNYSAINLFLGPASGSTKRKLPPDAEMTFRNTTELWARAESSTITSAQICLWEELP